MTEASRRSDGTALSSKSGKYFTKSSTAAFQALVAYSIAMCTMENENWARRRTITKDLIKTGMKHIENNTVHLVQY